MSLLLDNLVAPIVLAFALGAFARLVRSDLEIPPAIQTYLSIFLLLAIGLKGGVALRERPLLELAPPLLATIALGLVTCLVAFLAARALLRRGRIDAGAYAAHYGSVSAVTFIAAQQFTERAGTPGDPVLVALVVAMEIPALLLGVWLAGQRAHAGAHTLREVLVGRTALLLLGGLLIGLVSRDAGIAAIDDMYFELFQGMLMLFMLDLGMAAMARLGELRRDALRIVALGVALPLAHGLLGVAAGVALGFDAATATVFGAMTASASYIAAPATVRAALPEADLSLCLASALGITFPFNLAVGIPLYAAFAQRLAG